MSVSHRNYKKGGAHVGPHVILSHLLFLFPSSSLSMSSAARPAREGGSGRQRIVRRGRRRRTSVGKRGVGEGGEEAMAGACWRAVVGATRRGNRPQTAAGGVEGAWLEGRGECSWVHEASAAGGLEGAVVGAVGCTRRARGDSGEPSPPASGQYAPTAVATGNITSSRSGGGLCGRVMAAARFVGIPRRAAQSSSWS
jgi:hypothetical protein